MTRAVYRGLQDIQEAEHGRADAGTLAHCLAESSGGDLALLVESRIPKEPHGLVVEFLVQRELVLEVGIEGKSGRRHELDEPTLTESENVLASETGAAQDDNLSVRGAVGVRDAADRADEG